MLVIQKSPLAAVVFELKLLQAVWFLLIVGGWLLVGWFRVGWWLVVAWLLFHWHQLFFVVPQPEEIFAMVHPRNPAM